VFNIGSFVLGEEEVRKRKGYLEIGLEDERRLREAHPHLQRHTASIIDRFYDYLLGHEPTRLMLAAPGLVDRLKTQQTRYFNELTSGEYGVPYFENRLRVGQVHHRIGLSPEWYLGAYVKYLHIASDVLSNAFGRDYERFYQTIVSLTKVIYLDMGLALDAYHFSAQGVLESKNQELRKVQAAKQLLTDMIVHDLQNPLTGVTSALQMIQSSASELSAGARDILLEALRRCQDLSLMIMNVLQVSRAETGEIQVRPNDFDLAAVGREIADAFRRTAALEGRSIDLEAPAVAPLRSDETLVRRILQNLIRNALRHTPQGTRVAVRVDVPAGGGPRLSVSDDGQGIPEELQSRLFEPFASASVRHQGVRVDTGLGLPACKIMARAIGAEFSVKSDGRRGSVFILAFPKA
jgi:signal transduction histidine kinase